MNPPAKPATRRKDWYTVSVDTLKGWGIFLSLLALAGLGYLAWRHWELRALEREARESPGVAAKSVGELRQRLHPGPRHLKNRPHAHPYAPAIERIGASLGHDHSVSPHRRHRSEQSAHIGVINDVLENYNPRRRCQYVVQLRQDRSIHAGKRSAVEVKPSQRGEEILLTHNHRQRVEARKTLEELLQRGKPL